MKQIIIIIALCCIGIGVKAQVNKDTVKVDSDYLFIEYEIMPEFPGGTEKLMAFIKENLRYPEKAKAAHIEGRSIAEFVVEKDGSIVEPKVVKSLSPECDEEALRIVGLMPKWKPGNQRGKPVRVKMTVPFIFKLPQTD